MEQRAVALIGALLLSLVLATALGGMAIVSAVERRAAAAYRLTLELRSAAAGMAAVALGELALADWTPPLAGSGSAHWMRPQPGLDIAGLSAAIRADTMMMSSHGADTPVWQVFAQAAWPMVSGHPGTALVAVWVADDWAEGDGDPGRDSNGLLLVRAVAVSGVSTAWLEALCVREGEGGLRMRHARSW